MRPTTRVAALTRRLAAHAIDSTPDSRRASRELLLSTPWGSDIVNGVILHEESIRQHGATGIAFPDLLARRGIVTGIRVDRGAGLRAGSAGGHMPAGLDDLGDRLREYGALGARFAKWRARDSPQRQAAEPGVPAGQCAGVCPVCGHLPAAKARADRGAGSHDGRRVTPSSALKKSSAASCAPSSVSCGHTGPSRSARSDVEHGGPRDHVRRQASPEDVAAATIRCLRRHVPAAVPGVAFVSGDQDPFDATVHLNAIAQLPGPKPWALTYSFGRALQDEALTAWGGWPDRVVDGQRAFLHRGSLVAAAAMGRYSPAMEDARRRPPERVGRATGPVAHPSCRRPSGSAEAAEPGSSRGARDRASQVAHPTVVPVARENKSTGVRLADVHGWCACSPCQHHPGGPAYAQTGHRNRDGTPADGLCGGSEPQRSCAPAGGFAG